MARDRTRIRQEPLLAFGVPVYGGALIPTVGQDWFVDPNADVFVPKKKWGVGKSDDRPFATLEEALAACNTGDRIFIHGNIREEALIGSNLKFDVHIIGVGTRHHPDQPSSAYHPGAAMIRPPASPTATTDLLTIRGRGWQFHNVAFDCPVDAAAVVGIATADSGTDEYDGSHMKFYDCSFEQGLYGFKASGGLRGVEFHRCIFEIMTPTGAKAISDVAGAGVRANQYWKILNCIFPANGVSGGNECHIDVSLSGSLIKDSVFGTVEGSALYIDLTGGDHNIVTGNYLMGSYDTSDYVAGTGDGWSGNITADIAGNSSVADNGLTIAVPAAP